MGTGFRVQVCMKHCSLSVFPSHAVSFLFRTAFFGHSSLVGLVGSEDPGVPCAWEHIHLFAFL